MVRAAEQVGQLGDIGRNAPRFVAREQICRGSPAGFVLDIKGSQFGPARA